MKSFIRYCQKPALLLLVITVVLLLFKLSAWKLVEYKGYDLLVNLTAPQKQELPIIIVGIDDPSLQSIKHRWPWPRQVHADLIDVLNRENAAVIAFDVVFDQPSTAEDDTALAGAIERSGNVLLAARGVKQENYYGTLWSRQNPLRLFTEAGAGTGLTALEFDADFIVRKFPDSPDAFWLKVLEKLAASVEGLDVDLNSSRNGHLIRFLGGDHTFLYVSFYQALEPEKYLPPGTFENTLVLVGRNTIGSADIGSSQVDMFATPATFHTGRLTPGVEIHANLIENAFFDSSVRPSSTSQNVIVVFLVVSLSWLGIVTPRPWRSAALTVILVVSAIAAGYLSFFLFNVYQPFVALSLLPLGFYAGNTVASYWRERQNKLLIRKHFSLYVPEKVVEQLCDTPDGMKFGGEHRQLTILFADLESFTTLSENLPPRDVAQLLNEYFEELTRIIFKYNGTLDKFIGDAVMAFWGAPVTDPDHALKAVRAAQEMLSAREVISERLEKAGYPFLSIKIGINSGEAMVGNFGSTKRFSYTALGDTVNLASRLVGTNKEFGTDLLFSEKTAELIGQELAVKLVGRVTVKGKTTTTSVYTLED